jgi:hypothetical protein
MAPATQFGGRSDCTDSQGSPAACNTAKNLKRKVQDQADADGSERTQDSGPGSGKQKIRSRLVSERRDGKAKEVPERPGDSKKPGSFCKVYETEAMVAAYCGFQDISVFRRFALGPYALPFYIHFRQLKGLARKNKALELLRDIPLTDGTWNSNNDPNIIYPIANVDDLTAKSNSNHQMAWLAVQMLRTLKALPNLASPTDMHKEFKRLTGYEVPAMTLFEPSEIPDFGPLHDESDCEPYSRCLNVIKYLTFAATPSNWKRRFGSPGWDESRTISSDYYPRWMRADKKNKIGAIITGTRETVMDLVELFQGNKTLMIKYFDGYDVSTPAQRAAWQKEVLPNIVGRQRPLWEDKIDKSQKSAFAATTQEGSMECMNLEFSGEDMTEDEARLRYY